LSDTMDIRITVPTTTITHYKTPSDG
jgi:hypothetical protein